MRFVRLLPAVLSCGLVVTLTPGVRAQGKKTAAPPAPLSAPITNLRYDLTFDSATARQRSIRVALSFEVAGPGPVLLSLPAWTPGSYAISNFARWVVGFAAAGEDKALTWDKLDYDTWRVLPGGARSIKVSFDYLADSLDNAMSWAQPDFALFNGTNLLFYPEGRGFNLPATLTVKTEPGWQIATGMKPGPTAGSYSATNYHDLVDMPFFVGRMAYDSMQVSGHRARLATYPAAALTGPAREQLWTDISKIIPAESKVFQEIPWDSYNVMLIFDPRYGGASALEHGSSHVGVYNPGIIASPLLASITAHEIFHAWNVKRLRPAEMMPYDYDQPQPTPWLWVSEGITDYYADLALSRGAIIDSARFLALTAGKVATVAETPPTALEDASLSTWIHPVDGSGYLYYPKGSLAGFMLDIMIRDASDNARSLDDVMRELYQATYKRGRGFTGPEWWAAVSKAAGGRSFGDFNSRYVDGREPFPWQQVLPLAGLRIRSDTVREPRLGIATSGDSSGIMIAGVQPGGMAELAGARTGDQLLAIGDIAVSDLNFGPAFRSRFGKEDGGPLSIKVRRGTDTLTLNGKVQLVARVERRIEVDSAATEKAVRIRNGILKGTTGKS